MRATQHKSNNRVLGRPVDMNDVDAIAVTDEHLADGTPVVATYWTPSKEELLRLNAGELICVRWMGQTMPPARISVEKP